MEIAGQKFKPIETFDRIITVPDCFVLRSNKLGKGNGEAKLYIASRDVMNSFFGAATASGKKIHCFLVKRDLLSYLQTAKEEYFNPSESYQYSNVEDLRRLWQERLSKVQSLPEIIEFSIDQQHQIAGNRGYINSQDDGYQLIRELSLPLITYISVMEVSDSSLARLFYFRLFVDFEAVNHLKNGPLVYSYGKMKQDDSMARDDGHTDRKAYAKEVGRRQAREGQGIYRKKLLDECPFCPITMVNDERLLIASHIKPWVVSNDKEKVDPKNGYMLSPLYDKLFDRGFITFSDDRLMVISDWLSPKNKERLDLQENRFIQRLPMDSQRRRYLEYHRAHVFQSTGVFSF